MLADIIIIGGIFTAVVGSLDLLLSEKQKESFSRQVLRTWSRIDDLKIAFSRIWARRADESFQIVTAGLLALILAMNVIYHVYRQVVRIVDGEHVMNFWGDLILFAGMQAGAIWLADKLMIEFTLRATTIYRAAVRVSLMAIPVFIASLVTVALVADAGRRAGSLTYRFSNWDELLLVVYPIMITLGAVATLFWTILALPILMMAVLSAMLFVGELILRRVAEYQKGPIIGASLLFALVGGIYKSLS
jgi:hypothetical protein